jgi:ribosome modulation factor
MKDSRWYKEGFDIGDRELPESYCPYGERSAKALIWVEGWKDGTEFAKSETLKLAAKDDSTDD